MKLIYLSNARMPTEKAHGIHIMKMCEAFAESAQVELVLPARFNKIKENLFDYYNVPRKFKTKRLPCLDLIPWDKYFGYFALWLESFSFSISVFFYLLFNKADIIYARDKSLLFLSFFNKNVVFESHTFPKNYSLYGPFIKRLRGLVVITQKLKNLFVEKGILPERILVAPDGVDITMFDIKCSASSAKAKLNLPQDKKAVLYAGHLYEWKGVQILAEASRYLPENFEVYFVGGTAEDTEKFKIKNLKLKINIVGHRPYSEIPYWLKAADVLVLPNSGKEEISKLWTSPLKMFEYMASERPIVASNLPSIQEILNDKNAVLVEPDNALALADGIKKVLGDSKFSDEISKKAYLDVAENYTWLRRRKKIMEFINL